MDISPSLFKKFRTKEEGFEKKGEDFENLRRWEEMKGLS